ncbi:hypothetical protein [Roseospira navarrensis]|uniref:Uncharacterized protein n=1 Tax=Roseospira navarrensis TaxID=140058 RepID=A0A7X2D1R8_9PROT|nr:hypothetical protein [Roseospira navarrensis]MQX34971.1 hypothetical protein [Roseospira navarrensis]
MADDPENSVLVYLRRMDAKIDGVQETLKEHAFRLSRIEHSLNRIRQDMATDAEAGVLMQAQIDRIDRRLDLTDVPE